MNRAVFLDRDGTLMEEVNYCSRPEDVHVFAGVPEALQKLKQAGYLVIVITNQSGIGRGYFTEEDYVRIHAELERQCGHGVIDDEFHCPAHPDQSDPRRKPAPGMLLEAAKKHGISLKDSFMAGDKEIDVEAGKNAGTRTILVRTGYAKGATKSGANYIADDLNSAADWILLEGSTSP